jgi:hypothetical protein
MVNRTNSNPWFYIALAGLVIILCCIDSLQASDGPFLAPSATISNPNHKLITGNKTGRNITVVLHADAADLDCHSDDGIF